MAIAPNWFARIVGARGGMRGAHGMRTTAALEPHTPGIAHSHTCARYMAGIRCAAHAIL